jgi:4-amino-4-deoxy-L-arabinose transferase-like glycosyltransferase
MLGLAWLIYVYARAWMSRLGALAAATVFATFGQVMILGRFGESEAVFTMLSAGSLLVWHEGYVRGRAVALVWALGYSLAALAALAKGLQAPVYFVGATAAFLLARRDWRWLFAWGHVLGVACFAVIVGAWLVPFARAQWRALDDIWIALASDRFSLAGLARHMASYPVETLGCLLPWTPLLIGLAMPSVRRAIWTRRPQVQFLLVALAVTYPTVWLAAGARGRYYMPMYPCVALVMGLVVEHCTARGVSAADFALWRRYLRGLAAAALAGGVVLVAANLFSIPALADARQPAGFLIVWAAAAVAATAIALWAARSPTLPRPQIALLAAAAFVGFANAGAVLNARIRGGNDLAPAVAQIKQELPEPGELVSLGRVYHRFTYSYETSIRQVAWPMTAADLPEEVTYFCFDRRPGDTAEDRAGNDDRLGAHTPGTLPFAWEKIAEIPCDPVKRREAHRSVVIGRVRRPAMVAGSGENRRR